MYKKFQIAFIIVCISVLAGFSQSDTSRTMVQYSKDFHLNDGIYLTFEEFKNNNPQITQFEVPKGGIEIEGFYSALTYEKTDSTGKISTKKIRKCFGFCKNGIFYINANNNGFFRIFIMGALTHYFYYHTVYTDYYGSTDMFIWKHSEMNEFVLDFETGESFEFTYRDFIRFVVDRDPELYNEIIHTHGKRKLIHRFLLKYNERHPIYFPVDNGIQ